jgi:hypothetical protein
MASRQEQKQRAREERLAREREAAAAAAQRQRLYLIGGILAVVILVGAIAAIVASSGGSTKNPAVNQQGLQVSPGPWPPEYAHLQQRVSAMGLPDKGNELYHVHSQLNLYVDGKKFQVPSQVGIDINSQYLAALHTHDASGVIHQEAVQPYPFTLGQFFNVWGVKFTATQLGAYHVGKGLVLQTWANGKLVPNGPAYHLKPHDVIVVGFGKPGSFPTTVKFSFPAGE